MASELHVDAIKHSGGTSALTINSSGVVTNTQKPMWYGKLASDTTITRGSIIGVTGLTADEIDPHSAFDGETYTVPSNMGGVYCIFGQVCADFSQVGNDGEDVELYIYKNGSSILGHKYRIGQVADDNRDLTEFTPTITLLNNLSATDTIQLKCYVVDSAAGNARILATSSCFGGYML